MLMMNPKRHKRMSAGAMVGVMAGVGAAIISSTQRARESGRERVTDTSAAIADTLRSTTPTDGSGVPLIALVIGLLALGVGIVAFMRAQNPKS